MNKVINKVFNVAMGVALACIGVGTAIAGSTFVVNQFERPKKSEEKEETEE